MVWKKVNNADAGDATHHGGDSTDKISDAFSGVDVDDIDMNCDFTMRSGKGHLRNPGNTFSYNLVGGAIAANRNINYPVLTADDIPTFNATIGTLTNKSLDLEDNDLALRRGGIIFKDGSTYYAIRGDGSILSSSATAETVLQAALDTESYIFIADGNYDLSAGFTGLNWDRSNVTLEMGTAAHIRVPQGYTGAVFKIGFTDHVLGGEIRGGKLSEQGTPQKLWKGIHIYSPSSSEAVKHFLISHIQIDACGWCIYLEVGASGTGFINSCNIEYVYSYYPIIGMEWNNNGISDPGFNHATYNHIDIQADSGTTYGFKDVMGRNPIFICPTVQDQNNTQTQFQIHAQCSDCNIIGGHVIAGGSTGIFTDNGVRTKIYGARNINEGLRLNACNIVTDTTTGMKIGTATGQKIGFFNKTPVTQRTGIADVDGSTVDGTYGAEEQAVIISLRSKLNSILQVLEDMGITAVA